MLCSPTTSQHVAGCELKPPWQTTTGIPQGFQEEMLRKSEIEAARFSITVIVRLFHRKVQ